jgi:crotonobetainyl-CoA:carnitine CoA-transferase CaiB-like acyl-CoA transferase
MYAYTAVLTALLRRHATGEGTICEVSLFDALAEWMSFPAYHAAYSTEALRRSGPDHISIAPYGPFRTAGGQIYLAIQNTREWTRFCGEVLGRPAMADDERFRTNELRVRHRAELRAQIEGVLADLPMSEVLARLERAQIACARMSSLAELIEHPQLTTRDRWTRIGSEAGELRALLPPVIMEGVEPVMGGVPPLGADGAAILGELGFDEAQIAGWRREGVI